MMDMEVKLAQDCLPGLPLDRTLRVGVATCTKLADLTLLAKAEHALETGSGVGRGKESSLNVCSLL
jgi:hypothetical protein